MKCAEVEPFPAHHDFDPEEHALLHLRKQPADDPNDHEEPEGDANEMDDGAEAEDDNHDGEDDHNHDAEDYNASQDVKFLCPRRRRGGRFNCHEECGPPCD